jgi:hypothetical protein
MTTIPGTTKTQTIFLRAFRNSPSGPDPADWPSPAILRRWLRRPGFRAALNSLREAFRFQADFQLAASANQALKNLPAQQAPLNIADINRLLRISHLRQRFSADQPAPDVDPDIEHPQKSAPPPVDANDQPAKSAPPEEVPKHLQCPICKHRAPDPLWVGDESIFREAAFRAGYTAPLREWPNFPPPVPQDTFYYQLIQTPEALLRYMHLYDKAFNDHRFQPILLNCKFLLNNIDETEPPLFNT